MWPAVLRDLTQPIRLCGPEGEHRRRHIRVAPLDNAPHGRECRGELLADAGHAGHAVLPSLHVPGQTTGSGGTRPADRLHLDRGQPRTPAAAPTVGVDIHLLLERIRGPGRTAWEDGEHTDAVAGLTRTLLPGWSDDWLTVERERWDQVRVHNLECIARQLLAQEHYFAALETAMEAIAVEPIRETAHRIVIEIHLAEATRPPPLSTTSATVDYCSVS
jgi:hypothetical protein